MSNSQLTLLKNIKHYIDKLKSYDFNNYNQESYIKFYTYLENYILPLLSNDKINIDLHILKDMFNINVNENLLKDKNLYFLYEYICYNVFPDKKDFIKLIHLELTNLQYYSNIIYLNDYHISIYDDEDYEIDDLDSFISKLNNIKNNIYSNNNDNINEDNNEDNKILDFYIYTDKEIILTDLNKIFNINNCINIMHIHNNIHNNIYINDKLFLDYIALPRYMMVQYPNISKSPYNKYFKNYNIIDGFKDLKK